jgi:hypothetical protein
VLLISNVLTIKDDGEEALISSRRCSLLPVIPTVYPCDASNSAIPLPIPDVAPTTIAFLDINFYFMKF